MTNLHHPFIEACLLPWVLAFGLCGAIRLWVGREREQLAAFGIGVALLISTVLILDRDLWPPRSGLVKLPYILLGGLVLGLVFDIKPARAEVPVLLATGWMILILTWLGWPQIGRPEFFWILGGLFLSGLIMLLRIRRISPWLPDIGIMLSIAGAGLGGVAIASGSLVIGELSLALAAAMLGFTFWSVAGLGVSFGAASVFSGLFALLALGALTLLLTEASPIAVAMLVLIFFSDQMRCALASKMSGSVSSSIVLALIAIVPAAAAIGLAMLASGTDDIYYG